MSRRGLTPRWIGLRGDTCAHRRYFLADDPFFIFFLSLVLLVNGRDYVFELAKSPDTLCEQLTGVPSGLSAGDVQDMCALAQHFSSVTPTSFRADYSSQVFGTKKPPSQKGSAGIATSDIYHTLCLSVPIETVLRHTEGAIKFFIIDIRPVAQYDAGHLTYAWHLDATNMVNHPEVFAEHVGELKTALEESLQHPCFLSSGEADDEQDLSMVVSHFLQQKQNYVSIVKGGFNALHARLESDGRVQEVLEGTAADRKFKPPTQQELDEADAAKKKAAASFSSGWASSMKKFGTALSESKKSASAAYKSTADKIALKLAESKKAAEEAKKAKAEEDAKKAKDEAPSPQADGSATKDGEQKPSFFSSWKEKSKALSESLSKVSLSANKGSGDQMYRGKERVMFSIDDDDDEDGDMHTPGMGGGADLDLAGAVVRQSSSNELFVNVAKAQVQPSVQHYFQCSEISTEGYLFPSHILLTSTHMIKLRDRSKARGEAVVLSRRELSRIQRITAKKKHPNIFTFLYDTEASSSSSVEAGAAVDAAGPAAEAKDASASSTEADAASANLQTSETPPSDPSSNPQLPSRAALVQELFMIPDCQTAKQAFKNVIAAIRPMPLPPTKDEGSSSPAAASADVAATGISGDSLSTDTAAAIPAAASPTSDLLGLSTETATPISAPVDLLGITAEATPAVASNDLLGLLSPDSAADAGADAGAAFSIDDDDDDDEEEEDTAASGDLLGLGIDTGTATAAATLPSTASGDLLGLGLDTPTQAATPTADLLGL